MIFRAPLPRQLEARLNSRSRSITVRLRTKRAIPTQPYIHMANIIGPMPGLSMKETNISMIVLGMLLMTFQNSVRSQSSLRT